MVKRRSIQPQPRGPSRWSTPRSNGASHVQVIVMSLCVPSRSYDYCPLSVCFNVAVVQIVNISKLPRPRQSNKPNKINEDLQEHEEIENTLCMERLKHCKNTKTEPWTMEELEDVLKELGKDKSRDAMGYANEIFTLSVAGSDLKLGILKFVNFMKETQQFSQ